MNSDVQFFRWSKRNDLDLEFLPDSPEQIARSIIMTGLRTEIDQACEAAIARARGPRWPCQPAIKDIKEVDSRDNTSPKQ